MWVLSIAHMIFYVLVAFSHNLGTESFRFVKSDQVKKGVQRTKTVSTNIFIQTYGIKTKAIPQNTLDCHGSNFVDCPQHHVQVDKSRYDLLWLGFPEMNASACVCVTVWVKLRLEKKNGIPSTLGGTGIMAL